jgi:hypothetical protein
MSKATVVQNSETKLEGISLEVVDKSVIELTTAIFDNVIRNEDWRNIVDDLCKALIKELCENPLFTKIELTDRQKDSVQRALPNICETIKTQYAANIRQDERTQKIAELVSHNVRKIAEKVLAGVSQEVNRGAIINCVAVAADAKSEDYDQITLRKSKEAGDITIPTQCVLISTNCIEVIQNSVIVDTEKKDSKKSKKQGSKNA